MNLLSSFAAAAFPSAVSAASSSSSKPLRPSAAQYSVVADRSSKKAADEQRRPMRSASEPPPRSSKPSLPPRPATVRYQMPVDSSPHTSMVPVLPPKPAPAPLEISIQSSDSQTEEVFINVYSLNALNGCLAPIGLGMFHSGVIAFDKEYYFDSTGVKYMKVGAYPAKPYARHLIGTVVKNEALFESVINQMKESKWKDGMYHLFRRNCNDFSYSLAKKLDMNSPGYINRLSWWGACCIWFIPDFCLPSFGTYRPGADAMSKQEKRDARAHDIKVILLVLLLVGAIVLLLWINDMIQL